MIIKHVQIRVGSKVVGTIHIFRMRTKIKTRLDSDTVAVTVQTPLFSWSQAMRSESLTYTLILLFVKYV